MSDETNSEYLFPSAETSDTLQKKSESCEDMVRKKRMFSRITAMKFYKIFWNDISTYYIKAIYTAYMNCENFR